MKRYQAVLGVVAALGSVFAAPLALADVTVPLPAQQQASTLAKFPYLAPGAQIENTAMNITCAVGWPAKDNDSGKQGFLSAGHCGNVGDEIAFNGAPIGTVVWSTNTPQGPSTAQDDLLFVEVTVPGLLTSKVGIVDQSPSSVMSSATAMTVKPDMCKIGPKSGVTCGNYGLGTPGTSQVTFQAPSNHGDSGSPVVAKTTDGDIVAVGVLSGSPVLDRTMISTQLVDGPVQDKYHFTLLTDKQPDN